MPIVWTIFGSLGHASAAVLFASLAILTSRRGARTLEQQTLVVALALTALWSLRHALTGVVITGPATDGITETTRNAAWLAVIGVRMMNIQAGAPLRWGRPLVLGALVLLLLVQMAFDLLVGEGAPFHSKQLSILSASWLLRCTFALGALVLLHGVSTKRDHPQAAQGEVWVAAALAFMWAYDFNHYILTWLSNGDGSVTGPMRGFVMALLTVPIVIGLRTDGRRRLALSRPVALRLVSGGVIALYLFAVVLLVSLTGDMIAPFGRVVQLSVLFAMAVAVLALMPSTALRSWLRVEVTKHLFAHRYDYRAIWLGFAATVGKTSETTEPLGDRVTRAIAEVVQAPAAMLFLREDDGALLRAHDWQWPEESDPLDALDSDLIDRLEPSGWIVDIADEWTNFASMLPIWMANDPKAWVVAPLIHRLRLVGVVLLARPEVNRRIDWEDLDVLRVVCGEAAALISEARNREQLAEAQRFDEFNRRFAFILHDIKNLVSQMSLLASNAERHADNPAFRADMVFTLKETSQRMNDLLLRLGRPGSASGVEKTGVMIGGLVRALQPRWTSGVGQVEVRGEVTRAAQADQDGLERALLHFVKNAIEASPQGIPVLVEVGQDETHARIQVIDWGCGMTPEFIRDELFRPFSSTKMNGFGLGVHEAQRLITGMGGALEVKSTPGQGTCFTISLPLIEADKSPSKQGADPIRDTKDDLRRTG